MLYIVHNQGNFAVQGIMGKKNQCPLLDLKYKQDYRVVVAAMTLSKLLRINYLGMEITLILCVCVCVCVCVCIYIYIYIYTHIYCYIYIQLKEMFLKHVMMA